MAQQLVLAISPPAEPSLVNFVPGSNTELLARLRELADGSPRESVFYLWGEPGSGRSHLGSPQPRDHRFQSIVIPSVPDWMRP